MNQRPGSVTAVAIVNIVMAVLCGCSSLWMVATPAFMKMQQGMMESFSKQVEADINRRVAQLRQDRARATPEQQQRIDREIAQIQSEKMPDMSKFYGAFTSPSVKSFYLLSGIAGCLINLLFLISGIGLFSMSQWARKLAIGACVAAIVFALVSAVFNVLVIAPAMGQSMQEMMTEIQKISPPGQPTPPMPDMGGMMKFFSAAGSIFYLLIQCAWPVTAMILLSTKTSQDAFRAAAVHSRHSAP